MYTLITFFGISGQSLRFYCEDCETGICSSCTDIEHREHATVRMSDAVDAEKEEPRKLVERARTQVGWHGCKFPMQRNLNLSHYSAVQMYT